MATADIAAPEHLPQHGACEADGGKRVDAGFDGFLRLCSVHWGNQPEQMVDRLLHTLTDLVISVLEAVFPEHVYKVRQHQLRARCNVHKRSSDRR